MPAHESRVRAAGVVVAQVCVLITLSRICDAAVASLHAPLPGNLLALGLTVALLERKILPLEWIERGASLLTSHLALFFVPLAVGIVTVFPLVRSAVPGIVAILFISAGCGIAAGGLVARSMSVRRHLDEQP